MTITFLCTENDCFTSDRYAYSMSSFSLTPSYFPHAMIISKPHRWFTQHSITFVPSGGLFKCIFQRFPYGLITQLDLIRVCCVRTIRHKSYILSIIRHWIFVDFPPILRSIAIVWSALNLIQPADQPSLFYFWSESLERIRETINLHRWTAAASVRKHYYRQSYNYFVFFCFVSFLLLAYGTRCFLSFAAVNSLRSNKLEFSNVNERVSNRVDTTTRDLIILLINFFSQLDLCTNPIRFHDDESKAFSYFHLIFHLLQFDLLYKLNRVSYSKEKISTQIDKTDTIRK